MARPNCADRRGAPALRPLCRALAHARQAAAMTPGTVAPAVAAMALCALALPARAEPAPAANPTASPSPVAFEFSTDLLAGGVGPKIDVSRFALGNPQLAGNYRADVYLNGRWLMRRDLRLAGTPVVPCIEPELLRVLGLSAEGLSPEGAAALKGATAATTPAGTCRSLEALTRDARASFEPGELRLDITIPQASLARQPKGYVPPESWDRGVTAGLLAYNVNAYRSTGASSSGDSVFAGLNGGINIGRWRLRHSGSYTHTSAAGSHYTALGTWAATDLPDWRASLMVGDSNTTGQLFPSFKLRGVTLASDERMLPDSQRGYAPTIRGVANSNAKVEVRQNGNMLYSTSVPPGAFEINDLYPTGYGGDLQIIVTEADGSQRTTLLPYSSLPQLLRAGSLYYAVNAGRVLGYQSSHSALQGTVQYGLSDNVTLDGGLQLSERYAAALAGSAWNTPLGAVQANVTAASFRRNSTERHSGWSFDASWAKVFPSTSTNLNFAAYRYSSSGFYSLDDALRLQDYDASLYRGALPTFRVRNRAVLTVSQTLTAGLSFNLGINSQDYWDHQGRQSSYQLGLYKQLGPAQLSFNTTSSRNPGEGSTQRMYTLGLTLPLGGLGSSGNSRGNLTAFASHDKVNGSSQQVGFYGNSGERGELSYGLSHQRSSGGNTLSANGSYRGNYVNVGASASSGRGVNQQSFTASGGVVAADGHVVFAPYLGETVGLLHVEGAAGLRVAASQASELDSSGYTLLPYLSPYAANFVELNLDKAPLSARFSGTSAVVAPHAGSVVLLNFKRLSGYTLMLKARRPDGSAVPFGASVYDAQGLLVGSVAQAGRIEAASPSLTGTLRVTWGDDAAASCTIRYELPKPTGADDALVQAPVVCEPGAAPNPAPQRAAQATPPLPGTTREPWLLVVTDPAGLPLPRGAEVSLASDPSRIGVVAEGGRVVLRLLSGEASAGALHARWADAAGRPQGCELSRQAAAGGAAPAEAAACTVALSRFGSAREATAVSQLSLAP